MSVTFPSHLPVQQPRITVGDDGQVSVTIFDPCGNATVTPVWVECVVRGDRPGLMWFYVGALSVAPTEGIPTVPFPVETRAADFVQWGVSEVTDFPYEVMLTPVADLPALMRHVEAIEPEDPDATPEERSWFIHLGANLIGLGVTLALFPFAGAFSGFGGLAASAVIYRAAAFEPSSD